MADEKITITMGKKSVELKTEVKAVVMPLRKKKAGGGK